MNIVVLDGYTLNPGDLSWEKLENLGDFACYDRTPSSETLSRIGEAEIIFTNKVKLSKEIIEQSPNLKYIGVLATGYDVVDVKTAKEKGIIVSNIPTYGTTAVAQFVFAHILNICHHVHVHDESVKKGEWSNSSDWTYWKNPLVELADKTMGVIGMGRIGRNTGSIAKAFGMKVIGYDIFVSPEARAEFDIVELDELFSKSDYISLHCPLVPETKEIINAQNIAKMKDGVVLINTSRGPLVKEQDLAQALNSGKIAAVGIDVVSVEPILEDNPLLKAKNCVITPHIAWAPLESRARLLNIAIENLKAFLSGKPINVVS